MSRAAALAAAACLLAIWPGASSAGASDVNVAELQDLATRAGEDSAALAELRRVTSIEGAPYPVGVALQGTDPAQVEQRARTLAAGLAEAQAVIEANAEAAAEARRQAEELAGDAPELRPRVPGEEPGSSPESGRPGPSLPVGLLALIGVIVVVTAVVVSARLGQRRVASVERAAGGGRARRGRNPVRDLERQADDADARGDHADAVRLRFQAGLLALARSGRIDLRPSDTPRAVARRLGVEQLLALTGRFEEIVYGGRTAKAADSADAKSGWRLVLAGGKHA